MKCWSLSNIDQSPDASVTLLDLGLQPKIYALPGCVLAHTTAGVYLLDPITLVPMPYKMLQPGDSNAHSENDGVPKPQFDIADCTLNILSVFNINWSSNKDEQNTDNNTAISNPSLTTMVTEGNSVNDQSCVSCVAMAINYRLIVLKIMRR